MRGGFPYDPIGRVGGLIHCMLPLSRIDPAKAEKQSPDVRGYGHDRLDADALFDHGAQRKNLVAKVAGASRIMDAGGIFNIGERNYTVVRKVLWKNEILIAGEDVGGSAPRTMYLYMDSGRTILKVAGEEKEL